MCGVVGVFDSGVGGLSVLKECVKVLPCADYIYYADTAAAPYGNKPSSKIAALSLKAVDRLNDMGAEIVVVACNTATSAAIELLRERGRKVVGIEPSVKPAAASLKEGERALVLATEATIRQDKLNRLIDALGRERFVLSAQSGLATVIDSNIMDINRAGSYIMSALEPYTDDPSIKAVVLGCTHYVFARDIIARLMPSVSIWDGNAGVAKKLAAMTPYGGRAKGGCGENDVRARFVDTGGAGVHDYERVWQEVVLGRKTVTLV